MQNTVPAKKPRARKQSSKRQTVKVTLWVKPSCKAELERLAQSNRLTVSKTGGSLLEEAIRQQLHIQHAVLLQPIIEQAIRTQMRMVVTRLTWLFVRVGFDVGQTRILVTNMLNRIPHLPPTDVTQLLDYSGKVAKRNLTRRSPEMRSLIDA